MHGNVIIKNHRIIPSSKLFYKSLIHLYNNKMILTFEDSSLLFFETLSFFKDRNIHRRNIFTKEFFCISRCFTDWIHSAEFNNSKRERKETLMRTLYDVCKFMSCEKLRYFICCRVSAVIWVREKFSLANCEKLPNLCGRVALQRSARRSKRR